MFSKPLVSGVRSTKPLNGRAEQVERIGFRVIDLQASGPMVLIVGFTIQG